MTTDEALKLLNADWCVSIDGDVPGFQRIDGGIVNANEKGAIRFTVLSSPEWKKYRAEYFTPWERDYVTLADVNGRIEFQEVEREIVHDSRWVSRLNNTPRERLPG